MQGLMATESASLSKIEPVKLSRIVRDASFQVRHKLDPGTVKRYADLMKAGVSLNPITVALVNGVFMLVDGWHRVAAHEQLGRDHAFAEIINCGLQQAKWKAATANLTHGLPLKNSEYRKVFQAYVSTRQHLKSRGGIKSYREIGVELGKGFTTIRSWMIKDFPEIAARMGGNELVGEGGPREIEPPSIDPARDYLSQLNSLFQSSADQAFRGAIVAAVRETLTDMEASGGWVEPAPPDF